MKGKIVLLDFWTFCCINCHHVLPDLAKLEEKYKNELVVIGVHTAKFDAEKDTENIRRKVREYRIKHPVVNDANQVVWNRFGVNSWPTLVVIDANGQYHGSISGEGHYDVLDKEIGQLVEAHKAKDELDLTPLKFFARDGTALNGPSPLPRQGSRRSPRASVSSSPTPATTGSFRPTWRGPTPSSSAAARKASSMATMQKPSSTGRRECAWTARRFTSPTPRTTRSGPSI